MFTVEEDAKFRSTRGSLLSPSYWAWYVRDKAQGLANPSMLVREVLVGLTCALALIPEALSFSISADFTATSGLAGSIWIGFWTSLLTPRPGSLSAVSGAVSVVVQSLDKAWVPFALLIGVLTEFLLGAFNFVKVIRLVAPVIVTGFSCALALVIAVAQTSLMRVPTEADPEKEVWLTGSALAAFLGLTAISVLIVFGQPALLSRTPLRRWADFVPSSLVAILLGTGISFAIPDQYVRRIGAISSTKLTIGDIFTLRLPTDLDFSDKDALLAAIVAGIMVGIVALTESLLTIDVVENICVTKEAEELAARRAVSAPAAAARQLAELAEAADKDEDEDEANETDNDYSTSSGVFADAGACVSAAASPAPLCETPGRCSVDLTNVSMGPTPISSESGLETPATAFSGPAFMLPPTGTPATEPRPRSSVWRRVGISRYQQETFGQALGLVFCALVGGVGGDQLLGQAQIASGSGARTRVANFSSTLFLLILCLSLSKYVEYIPVAILVGIMVAVVIKTFDWQFLFRSVMLRVPLGDIFAVVAIIVGTFLLNLAAGVVMGVVILSFVQMWRASHTAPGAALAVEADVSGSVETVSLSGLLHFASAAVLEEMLSAAAMAGRPPALVIDLSEVRIGDSSGTSALLAAVERARRLGRSVQLVGVEALDTCRGARKAATEAGLLEVVNDSA